MAAMLINPLDQFFVYHPHPWIERDWRRASGLPLEDVWVVADDGASLFGWYVEAKQAHSVMLWCHGNAGNIIHRLDNLVELFRAGFSVFLFDYRGYGRSAGTPSESGFYLDAQAAYAYLTVKRRIDPGRLVLFGRSLGAAVAGELAATKTAAGLILESAFPSVGALARAHYFGLPVHWLLGARFDLEERLARITIPTLVVHGDRDRIVPLALGRAVYEAVRGPKSFYLVPGADHNDLYEVGGAAYFQRLKTFASEVVR
jgi:fermentation-respiration switch protein FrsA (DUF1100 family)